MTSPRHRFCTGLGLMKNMAYPTMKRMKPRPSQNSHDAEAGCGQIEDQGRQQDEHRPEHNPAGGDGEGASGDGLLEVLPGESSESLLAATLWGIAQAEVASLLEDLLDLSLVLLRHVTTLGSKGRDRWGSRSDFWLPRSTVSRVLPIDESYLLGLCGVKT